MISYKRIHEQQIHTQWYLIKEYMNNKWYLRKEYMNNKHTHNDILEKNTWTTNTHTMISYKRIHEQQIHTQWYLRKEYMNNKYTHNDIL